MVVHLRQLTEFLDLPPVRGSVFKGGVVTFIKLCNLPKPDQNQKENKKVKENCNAEFVKFLESSNN